MSSIRTLAVYCGSSAGNDPRLMASAASAGRWLAERKITVVYGGGKRGLMGAVANRALAAGGKVIGVMMSNAKRPSQQPFSLLEIAMRKRYGWMAFRERAIAPLVSRGLHIKIPFGIHSAITKTNNKDITHCL